MPVTQTPPILDQEVDLRLLRAVPPNALRVLLVGSGTGRLGAALKRARPDVQVFGVERDLDAGVTAASRLDRLNSLNIETDDPPLEPGSLDAILYSALEQLGDPEGVLRRHRSLLKTDGVAIVSVANAQHHSVLSVLASGDLPPRWHFPASRVPARVFTLSATQKLLLDAGYAPDLVDVAADPAPASFLDSFRPLAEPLRLSRRRARLEVDAKRYVFRAWPIADVAGPVPGRDAFPMTFVVCVSDEAVLAANLLASPDLGPDSPHELILVRNCPSAAFGLNLGLERARHSLVIGVHQDVYLPRGWCRRFATRWQESQAHFGRIGLVGVYGISGQGETARRAGHVVDRIRLLRESPLLPMAAHSLDELLLAISRDSPVRFDPALGFHLYGTDACLAAARHGLANVIIDAPCLHSSRGEQLPNDFQRSADVLAAKWPTALPVATSCVKITSVGRFREW